MTNVITLASYRAAPARKAAPKARAIRKAAPKPIVCRISQCKPDDLAPGLERKHAVIFDLNTALYQTQSFNNPRAAPVNAKRAVAVLKLMCAEVALTKKNGSAA